MTTIDILNSLVARGIATPVKYSDAIIYNYNGVPPCKQEWSIFSNRSNMDISLPLPLFQKHIKIILSRIEGVRYSWDNNMCVWHIEYGTFPFENGKPRDEFIQIKRGKNAALCAAMAAIEKFPHLVDHDDIWDDNNIGFYDIKSWCKMELRIYTDRKKNGFFIVLNRMSGDGDRATHWFIWREIYTYFAGNIFLPRCSFLELVEGVEYDETNHINKYLLNDMLVKEFCTFMQHD
jgi:hypothetical protein